jgi:ferredoxin
MRKIKVVVDEDLCIGAASCVTIAPETFQMNEENKAWVLDHGQEPDGHKYERVMEVTDDEYENILLGAQSCPTLAVFIFDEEGAQLFPDM